MGNDEGVAAQEGLVFGERIIHFGGESRLTYGFIKALAFDKIWIDKSKG